MRVSRSAAVWMALLIVTASTAVARAQTAAPESRFYGEFTAAATLGHKSDSAVGGEVGMHINDWLDGFLEGGHMGNVATQDRDDRAATIASFIGGSSTVIQKANFLDIGAKYRGPAFARLWRPYVGFGVGFARVETISSFQVAGADVTSQLESVYGVVLGLDLSGKISKAFIVVPVGVQGTYGKWLVIDGSYRYGRIAARPSDITQDVGISTQRVQVGVGIRF